MSDVFDEIMELKRALELAKIAIKKCSGKVNWQSVGESHEAGGAAVGEGDENGVLAENATGEEHNE